MFIQTISSKSQREWWKSHVEGIRDLKYSLGAVGIGILQIISVTNKRKQFWETKYKLKTEETRK
jgi:hypothetical protein